MGMLLFRREFFEAIRDGRKSTTVRRWARPRVRADTSATVPGLGRVRIESVERIDLEQIGESDAAADGFESAESMLGKLRQLYPNSAGDGKQWFRVRFTMINAPG